MEINIEDVIEAIIDGKTYRAMAKEFDVKVTTLHDFCNKPEHSARVKDALEVSASSYDEKAEEVLLLAEASQFEMQRARELAQHYRWKASKRSPKRYGDNSKVEIDLNQKNLPTWLNESES